ncbi:MAG: hypothetical protein KDB10_17200, partial [Acidimicrobiales bacterium]|nr:hypothetical protein [Acidimicrobiales bacterium]
MAIEVLDAPPEASGTGTPWWDPLGTVDHARSAWRRLERQLARQPLARLGVAGPRTARWMV